MGERKCKIVEYILNITYKIRLTQPMTRVLPGHDCDTSIADEKRYNFADYGRQKLAQRKNIKDKPHKRTDEEKPVKFAAAEELQRYKKYQCEHYPEKSVQNRRSNL